MNLSWKSGALLALVVALGVAGGMQLSQLLNKAKMAPPAKA